MKNKQILSLITCIIFLLSPALGGFATDNDEPPYHDTAIYALITDLAFSSTRLSNDIDIDQDMGSVKIKVPADLDLSDLPYITVVTDIPATVTQDSTDFTNGPVKFTTSTGEPESLDKEYMVTLVKAPQTDNFEIFNTTTDKDVIIDQLNNTISLSVPAGTNLATILPIITVNDSTAIDKIYLGGVLYEEGVSHHDFSGEQPIILTIEDNDGFKRDYSVTIMVRPALSSDKQIDEFVLNGVLGKIDQTKNTITVTLPRGTKLATVASVCPTVKFTGRELSPKATVEDIVGIEQDFSDKKNTVKYTVTAQDGSTRTYEIKVTVSSGSVSVGGGVGTTAPVNLYIFDSDTDITKKEITLKAGSELPLRVKQNTTIINQNIKWTSEYPDIAYVTDNGVVKALKPGKSEIRASYNGRDAVIIVNVIEDDTITPPAEDKPVESKPKEFHKQYIHGYSDGSIRPDNYVTRAEVSAMLNRLLDESKITTPVADIQYIDVDPNEWFAPYINTLTRAGIINGQYSEEGTVFRPNDGMTRAEFACVLVKYAAIMECSKIPLSNADKKIRFTDNLPNWAKESITTAYENGYIKGYLDNTFKPDNCITRAEAVTMLNRVLGRNFTSEKSASQAKNQPQYVDLTDTPYWAYYDIIEASFDHSAERDSNNIEVWEN